MLQQRQNHWQQKQTWYKCKNNPTKRGMIKRKISTILRTLSLVLLTSSLRKKSNCFVCGKPSHHAPQCHFRATRNDNPPKAKVNLAERDDIIAAVISQVNIVTNVSKWVVDSGLLATYVQIEMPFHLTLLWRMEKSKSTLVILGPLRF